MVWLGREFKIHPIPPPATARGHLPCNRFKPIKCSEQPAHHYLASLQPQSKVLMRKFYSTVFPVLLQPLFPFLCVSYLFSFFQRVFFFSEKQLFFWGPWSERKIYSWGCDTELAFIEYIFILLGRFCNEEIYIILQVCTFPGFWDIN